MVTVIQFGINDSSYTTSYRLSLLLYRTHRLATRRQTDGRTNETL